MLHRGPSEHPNLNNRSFDFGADRDQIDIQEFKTRFYRGIVRFFRPTP